jgi:anti-anti-sigma regulatory factor
MAPDAPSPLWDLVEAPEALIVRLRPSWIVGLDTAQRLRDGLLALTTGGAAPRLILDLGGVELFDSMFLSSLFTVLRQLRERGGRLALTNIRPGNAEVLANLPIHHVAGLRVLPDLDAARAWCAAEVLDRGPDDELVV